MCPTNTGERRPRVFIADDHDSMLRAVERVLGAEFQVVGTASNGAQALSEILSLQPDIVIMDILMPEMSGIEACETLKQRGSKSKILFVSASDDPMIRFVAMKSGGDGFLKKSQLYPDLVRTVLAILEGRPSDSNASSPHR